MSATTAVEQSWPAEAATVPAARLFVRRYLVEQQLQGLRDDAELIVTELVSNVVLHVGGTVRVRLTATADELRLEVSDDSPVPPLLRTLSQTSSTGRGMRLVHSLSAEHGVRPWHSGKTIWVRLTSASSSRGDDEITATFADVDWLAELTDVDLDGSSPTVHVLRLAA